MNNRKSKRGITALLIVGIVFCILGITYLTVGICTAVFGADGAGAFFLSSFGGMGAAFLVAGGICIGIEIAARRRNERLLASGRYITAEISEITRNYMVRVNRRYPYVIICRYQDTAGTIHLFKSRNLMFDPEPLLKDRMVRVYVDGEDYKHYYVDIDEVLPAVIQH